MDFILLMLFYLSLCSAIICCYINDWILQYKPFSIMALAVNKALEVLDSILPISIKRDVLLICHGFIKHRNVLFLGIYIFLVLGSCVVIFIEALPHLYDREPNKNHVMWIIIGLVFNIFCFLTCRLSDPGYITPKNFTFYKDKYKYDELLYTSGRICPTCKIEKIPRSKHCAISNKCVYKFDHYCLFTNSCVGGLNHKYFILFLVSVCSMVCAGFKSVWYSLQSIVHTQQFWLVRYVDSSGQAQAMNLKVLIQTLFMRYPRLVFMCTVLPLILLAVGLFTVYHLYLVATNQTTNERYRISELRKDNIDVKYHPYSNGLQNNLLELLFPLKNCVVGNNKVYDSSSVKVKQNIRKKKS